MHGDLHMRNLERIPFSIRRVVSAAVGPTRTFSNVQRARDLMDDSKLSDAQKLAFLPILYANLDSDKVPAAPLVDELARHPTVVDDIRCAVVSLEAVFGMRLNGEVGVFLWPRVAVWIDFIDLHRKLLPETICDLLPADMTLYTDFMSFCGPLHDDPETYAIMASTPRFWRWLVKTLTFLPRIPEQYLRAIMLNDIGGFLADSGVRSHPERLEEMIDMTGGSIDDFFAPLIWEYLHSAIQDPSPDPNIPLECIQHLITFIKDADAFPINCEDEWLTVPIGPLGRALYECDFAEELVSAFLFFCDSDKPLIDAPYPIDQCMKLFQRMIFASSPALWAEEVLERGLLRVLVLITLKCDSHGWRIDHWVRFYLQIQLPPALVYYYALGTFEESLEKIHDLLSADAFKNSTLCDHWRQFLGYMQERVDALDEFAAKTVAYKTCDNLRCGSIEDTDNIAGRCSGCQGFYYCSRECQKVDWKAGHRTFCHNHQTLLLTRSASDPHLVFAERSFLRHLLHHKYIKERRSIWVQQVNILATQTGERSVSPVLFTLFDFCKSPPLITVYDVDTGGFELNDSDDTTSPEWEDLVDRARRSEGRMQLHGLRVLEGPPRVWVIPLRSESPQGYECLRDLAARVRAGEVKETGVMEEIDVILGSAGDVMEVH
ncbi:hypothetical protein FB45DRAFT_1004844 [Roridomyces roridus]|uniref:MYND-type domain-containing protein n=1 Tax=Roridomyces roridus TaxID=1738132 RepID=A0AAD7BQ90_9AGAR|nr:hypothetical protein FB45DRAFT_1004844 [Roridomyces roridus]